MREVEVKLRCDMCREPMDGDPIDTNGEKLVLFGNTYAIDLCEECVEKVNHLFSWLPQPLSTRGYGRDLQCDLCGFTAKSTGGLGTHKARKHSLRKPKRKGGDILCHECGEGFAGYQGLASHRKWHDRQREQNTRRRGKSA